MSAGESILGQCGQWDYFGPGNFNSILFSASVSGTVGGSVIAGSGEQTFNRLSVRSGGEVYVGRPNTFILVQFCERSYTTGCIHLELQPGLSFTFPITHTPGSPSDGSATLSIGDYIDPDTGLCTGQVALDMAVNGSFLVSPPIDLSGLVGTHSFTLDVGTEHYEFEIDIS